MAVQKTIALSGARTLSHRRRSNPNNICVIKVLHERNGKSFTCCAHGRDVTGLSPASQILARGHEGARRRGRLRPQASGVPNGGRRLDAQQGDPGADRAAAERTPAVFLAATLVITATSSSTVAMSSSKPSRAGGNDWIPAGKNAGIVGNLNGAGLLARHVARRLIPTVLGGTAELECAVIIDRMRVVPLLQARLGGIIRKRRVCERGPLNRGHRILCVVMLDMYNYSLPTIFLVGFLVILGASEIGRGLAYIATVAEAAMYPR